MNKDTIMPDGRPMFAWENEIEMNRSERQQFQANKKELGMMMTLLNIVEVEQTQEPHTGDYLFRIRRSDIVHAYNPISALEKAEISRLPSDNKN